MPFKTELARVSLAAFLSLMACALLYFFYALAWPLFSGAGTWGLDLLSRAGALSAVFLFLGALATFGYCAPVYAWSRRRNAARWWTAALIGVMPGVAAVALGNFWGVYLVAGGTAVSLLTHGIHARLWGGRDR